MKKLSITTLAILLASVLYGQKIERPDVQLSEDEIIIAFDLVPKESVQELYAVEIRSSADGYTKALKVKKGKVEDARPGNRLQYVISGMENFSEYKGDLDFMIIAKMTYSPIRILSPGDNATVVKGKPMNIEWRGGFDDDKYAVDLYEGNQKVTSINGNVMDRKYTWNVPKEHKTGNFKFRLMSDKNPGQPVYSSEFRIKKKFPILLVLAPVAVIGGVLAATSGGSGDGTTPGGNNGGDTEESLPDPPDLPTPGG